MIMGASSFPGVLVRGSRARFATGGRGLGDLMTDCEGPHPLCSALDQACIANWQNIVSSCSPVPPGASITRQLSTSSPKFAAQLASAGGDEMLALQAAGNPVLPAHPAAAWWGGPGASVAGNPLPFSSSHHNPGATPTNPLQQQVRINPTNLPIHPLDPRPPLRGGYGQNYLPVGTLMPGWYSTVPMPRIGNSAGLGRLRHRTRGFGQPQTDAFGNPVSCPAGQHWAAGACVELCNQSTVADQYACVQRNEATWNASPNVGTPPPYIPAPTTTTVVTQPPAVVNPSPTTQLTNTGTSQASPTSVRNLSAGLQPLLIDGIYTGGPVSTVGGTVSGGSWFTDPTQDLIGGLPNWALLVMAGAGLFVVVSIAGKR